MYKNVKYCSSPVLVQDVVRSPQLPRGPQQPFTFFQASRHLFPLPSTPYCQLGVSLLSSFSLATDDLKLFQAFISHYIFKSCQLPLSNSVFFFVAIFFITSSLFTRSIYEILSILLQNNIASCFLLICGDNVQHTLLQKRVDITQQIQFYVSNKIFLFRTISLGFSKVIFRLSDACSDLGPMFSI